MENSPNNLEHMSLTDYEVIGLSSSSNLADGHAYQDLNQAQRQIVEKLSHIWRMSETEPHSLAEDRFIDAFSKLACTPSLAQSDTSKLICPTASNSIDIAAAYIKTIGRVVHLVEPTFDNLFLLMRRRGVEIKPIAEDLIYTSELDKLDRDLSCLTGQALFIVNPNNPTGKTFDEFRFREIVRICTYHDILLIVDSSFRFHKRVHFDEYKILIDSTISFICIEDTGKVWPTQDMKASILSFSANIKPIISEIYYELYLCASPFALNIISSFIESAYANGLDATLWKIIDMRRTQLRSILPPKELAVPMTAIDSMLGVEWLECINASYNDVATVARLQESGLAILPGRNFFWASSHNHQYQKYVRVSLLKKEPEFFLGLQRLAQYIRHADYQ